jgi:predicted phage terminase large subunit-like protein
MTLTNEELLPILLSMRMSPASFATVISNGSWKPARHLRLISEYLVRSAMGEAGFTRTILTVPPRHGKSEEVSKYNPAWYLENWPAKRVMLISYADEFASTFGRAVRDLLHGNSALLTVRIKEDVKAAHRWMTTAGGGMSTAGVGGPITGKGADMLIVDDPVKNEEEAESKTIREKAWNWWRSTAYTRIEPGGSAFVVMTRWNYDDLAGRLIQEMKVGGEHWNVINIPAICESENDPLGRKIGEALWPERYDEKALARIQNAVGSRVWNALYQQRPSPEEGGIFKKNWFQYYDERPEDMARKCDRIIQSWDCSFKDTDGSDYVVGQCWGRRGANHFLLDEDRARRSEPETEKAIARMSQKWPRSLEKLVEDKANGPAVIQRLRDKIPGLIAVPANGSKEGRANAIAPMFEAHNVYLPKKENHPWVEDYELELLAFPNGAFDDRVDSTAHALMRLGRTFRRIITVN